ncbi:zinc finger protein 654-like [Scleropages formosus]|uniref:Zinc finger protein 654-like n=1 Tax=Scleropages formosus TaxID=113540 RepID=A0A0N8JY78_SCLFO|nr:zinc finger protein 654-like [Scleropages formosus]
MAEEESDLESERLKEELESLWDLTRTDQHGVKSKIYCSRFCELVEEHTARWQVPLPQLQVLRTALCYFTHSTASFPCGCEHVQYALSSLALSFFELLLFFGKDEFLEDPLKDILLSFQDCFLCLGRHKNMHLQLVNQIVQDGGPWENPILQAILKESAQSQDEVKQYLSSEVPVFFELRIRYLLACERIQEAVALAKTCIEHPEARRHLYFHQVYLTCLWKASLFDLLRKEMAVIDGRDAVEILCNTEREEKDDLLLAFSKEFLTQQLQSGDMYCMWDLVFIWSKLHLRANPSKQDFMEECHQLMMCANNIKSIFPFMKIIIDEMGNEGLQFCVELCARALQMDLHHDPVTKSLIYKTIAFLLPNDLEVCRACALLVFFLERTVESYKTVYLLYTHPDQEYHVDSILIKNDIRFEILQILKKGLFFDPEFWNLITLRRNCLKLMNEKVMKAALNEIMEEDKWIPNYCMKEPYKFHSDCSANQAATHNRKDANKPEAKCGGVALEANATPPARRRGRKPGTRFPKVAGTCQLRRSFRQLDMAQESSNRQRGSRQQRHLARQVEKKTLKRRGRKPRLDEEQPAVLLQTEGSDDISAGYLPGAPPKIESSVLKYRCRQCSKEFRGGNIMRHAVAHLQKDKFKCIFCGKVFKRRHIAERHLTKHIEKIKMRNSLISNSTRESGSCEALDHANLSLADDEDKKALRVGAGDTISSNRKINNKPKDVHHAEEEKMTESRRAKLKANGFIEAGQLPSGKEGYCCPADGCDMVFPRRELSLIRHAMKSHPDDAKVQEYAFDWRKGKCHFCKRVFLSLPHYKDHVLEHNHPLKHPCLHHDCKRRFKTQTELRGHMRNHEHFQAKCSFAGCHQRFNHLGQLFSHESSHYLTPEAKSSSVKRDSEVQGSPGRQDQEDDQDDDSFVWREKSDHKTYVLSGGGKGTTNSAASNSEQQVSPAADAGLGPEPAECANSAESCFSDRQLVNGHSKHEGGLVISASVESGSPQKDEEETKAGVTDLEMRVTPASSTGQRRSAAQGHKAAREEERPPYGGTSNKPFLRLSPSAYLDEKYISMPKRRKPSADPSPAPAEQKEPHAGTQRQRCTKCFCSFGSTEELQKHLSSNKCMSLFDSDEEGAW